jgi:hypothetical protein
MKEINNISGKNPFRVPENYFEEVNRKIISATSLNYPAQEGISLYRRLRPYLAAAASVALVALLSYSAVYIYSAYNKSAIPEITLNEFSDNYLNEIDLLTLENSALSLNSGIPEMSLSSNDIVDYFVLENIDINEIY